MTSPPSGWPGEDLPPAPPEDRSHRGWLNNANRLAGIAIVVSILSLVATGAQAIYAAGQLAEAQRQFDLSGPQLKLSGSLFSPFGQDVESTSGSVVHIPKASFDGTPGGYYYQLTIVNNGRAETEVTSAWLDLGIGQKNWGTADCTLDMFNDGRGCGARTYTLKPGHTLFVTFTIGAGQTGANRSDLTDGYPAEVSGTGMRESPVVLDTRFVVDD